MTELYDALIEELKIMVEAGDLTPDALEAAKHFIVAYEEGRVTIIPTVR